MSTESPEPYYRNDRHMLAHVRAQGMYNLHDYKHVHRNMRDFPGHPVEVDGRWQEVAMVQSPPEGSVWVEQAPTPPKVRIVTIEDRLREALEQIEALKAEAKDKL